MGPAAVERVFGSIVALSGKSNKLARGTLEAFMRSPSSPSSSEDQSITGSSGGITVVEIGRRLNVGRLAVYAMLEQRIIPGGRVGRRWIITRHAYEEWERTCRIRSGTGLNPQPEVMVLN